MFRRQRNLVRMVETDAWWRESLAMVHLTPQPVAAEAHLTLVLEGTREALGLRGPAEGGLDIYERPLLYFAPKVGRAGWWQARASQSPLGSF